MALSIANKALIGGISSFALGGVGYGAYSYMNATVSIKDTLIKDGKTPLNLDSADSKDTELLEELAKQYFNKKPTGKKEIEGLKLTNKNDTEGLKKQCQKLFETNNGDKDYERKLREAEEWCTKENAPRKITSLLSAGKKLLEESDGAKWNEPWKRFKADHNDSEPVGDWKIDTWGTIKGQEANQAKGFKDKCIANGKLSIIPEKQKDLLAKIERYCTKNANG